MTRVVLDASVLVSATVARLDSPPSLLISAARTGEIELVACEHLLSEVDGALGGPYFRDRVSAEERSAFIAMLRSLAVLLPDPESPPRLLRDSSDDYLVALARAAIAELIVTGDRDLLDHSELAPPAVSPRHACDLLGLTAADDPRSG